MTRLRKHLNRLTATGVVRLADDRTAYRLTQRRSGGPPSRSARRGRVAWPSAR
jgi:hypothetical protein